VPISIRDALNSPRDRRWIQTQYPEYLEDLSHMSMNTGAFPTGGEVQAELMARWFADDSSYPLIILKNEQPAGFALVSRPPRNRREHVDFRMAEFFVELKSRRLGVGRDAAQLIFNRFAGNWEIIEFLHNKSAVRFWRAILTEYTGGNYQEAVAHGEVRQLFSSANRQRAR
jgi:predicted acetyltransferase